MLEICRRKKRVFFRFPHKFWTGVSLPIFFFHFWLGNTKRFATPKKMTLRKNGKNSDFLSTHFRPKSLTFRATSVNVAHQGRVSGSTSYNARSGSATNFSNCSRQDCGWWPEELSSPRIFLTRKVSFNWVLLEKRSLSSGLSFYPHDSIFTTALALLPFFVLFNPAPQHLQEATL